MFKRLVTRYWLLLPLLILTVVLLDRVETPETIETEATIDMRATESDYYLSDFTTRKFNVDGTIEYKLAGATLAHYPADDRSQISAPRVELRRDNVQWLITSRSGRFDPAPNLFTLTGDVTVTRVIASDQNKNENNEDSVVLTTQVLRIATDDNRVETDQPVEIVAPTWQLTAKGLRTAIDDGQLRLLSDVVGQYQMPASSRISEPESDN